MESFNVILSSHFGSSNYSGTSMKYRISYLCPYFNHPTANCEKSDSILKIYWKIQSPSLMLDLENKFQIGNLLLKITNSTVSFI